MIGHRILAWVLALAICYVTAVVAATQSVLARLAEMGVAIPLGDRLWTIGQDLLGMTTSYLPLIAIALTLGFAVAALILRWRPNWRSFGYPLAGGVAILVLHQTMIVVFGFTPVAAVRTTGGLLVQVLCGVMGGWVFLRLAPRPATPA